MELHRLVIEDADTALAVDFGPGLTVASHENPAVRHRFVTGLVEALGPGRDGLHLECADARGRQLAVFRPYGAPHQVIDIDSAEVVTSEFAAPGGRVDVLRPTGLDVAAATRHVRFTADDLEGQLVQRLAAVDQDELWAAAEELAAANARLDALTDGQADAVERAIAYEGALEAHQATARAEAAHRRTTRLGLSIGLGLAAIAAGLVLFEGLLDDDRWTARALLVLAVVALALTLWDRREVFGAQRAERRALVGTGQPDLASLRASIGALADDGVRASVLAAARAREPLAARFAAAAGGVTLEDALAHRRAVQELAARRREASGHLAELTNGDVALAVTARPLVERVVALRHVGAQHERLPLVLDEPFIGLDPADTARLLEVVRHLAHDHQVVLVTGDPDIEQWAAHHDVGLVRLGRALSLT